MSEPKKRLGQHWLNDTASLEAIAAAADLSSSDTVLEVGPGLGSLTDYLASSAKKVVAVELDDDLIARLKQRFIDTNVELEHASILDFDLTKLPAGYKVVANIPYYLTGKLVRQLMTSSNPPAVAVLLVQKEVAERITAEAGSMSILSVSVQFYAKAEALDIIDRSLFTPPPQVDSQIVRITRFEQPILAVNEPKFFRLVKAGFGERRKKLRSSLAGGLALDKADVDAALSAANISDTARAQELSLSNWEALYNQLEENL